MYMLNPNLLLARLNQRRGGLCPWLSLPCGRVPERSRFRRFEETAHDAASPQVLIAHALSITAEKNRSNLTVDLMYSQVNKTASELQLLSRRLPERDIPAPILVYERVHGMKNRIEWPLNKKGPCKMPKHTLKHVDVYALLICQPEASVP